MHTPMVRRLTQRGFTLIELIVVMTIISLLLTLAAPRYFRSIELSKETVLKANLTSTRGPTGCGIQNSPFRRFDDSTFAVTLVCGSRGGG